MDLEENRLESEATNHKDLLNPSKPCEPIITFSPDRCRFDLVGGEKSRNLSSDLAAEINSVLGEYEGNETSLTHLLTTSPVRTNNLNSKNPESEQVTQQLTTSNANNSSSGIQLQKRLAKQIAQASQQQPSTSKGVQSSSSSSANVIKEEETEFGEWAGPEKLTNMENNNRESRGESVEIDSAEVEVITTKSTNQRLSFEGRKSVGLIPPERLQIPNKPNANHSQRKQTNAKLGANNKSATNNKRMPNNGNLKRGDAVGDESRVNSTSGPTSEVKPLVQWDSDESEEELSFFPGAKTKGKLTDNLSIDNMSLSGEEDDLHLAPPRPLTRNCPCDPRPWVNSHLAKLPSPSRASEHCSIT